MKLATIALLGILLLGSFPPIHADEKAAGPAGASQVVMAFTGGSAYTETGGICMFYPLLLGDLNPQSLFAPLPLPRVPDKEHAYLIWVSDFSAVPLAPFRLPPSSNGLFTLQLIPTGTATFYFSDRPDMRDWRNLERNNRSTWGDPVARLVRKAGIFQSIDGGISGTLTFSVELVSSKPFKLNGKTFNFRDLIPHGMTCFETGFGGNDNGDDEAGTCIATGGGQ